MKSTKIIYWTTTILLFLFEGVMPALTSTSDEAKQGISQLGYPAYFGVMLTVFKVLGSLGLLLPFVKGRVKEWVYAGFAFDFICAAVSLSVVFGLTGLLLVPVVAFAILVISYITYHRLQNASQSQPLPAKKSVLAF